MYGRALASATMAAGPNASLEPLPDFRSPPLAEVALAVQFEPGTVTAMDALTFRTRVQEEFPRYEEQPARPPMSEEFGTTSGVPQLRVELLPAPSTPTDDDPTHGLIYGRKSDGIQRALARTAEWTVPPAHASCERPYM
jgi:hypothetical protein